MEMSINSQWTCRICFLSTFSIANTGARTGHWYEFWLCAGVVVFIEHFLTTSATGAGAAGSVGLHQNVSHTQTHNMTFSLKPYDLGTTLTLTDVHSEGWSGAAVQDIRRN